MWVWLIRYLLRWLRFIQTVRTLRPCQVRVLSFNCVCSSHRIYGVRWYIILYHKLLDILNKYGLYTAGWLRECLQSVSAESFVFQFAIQKYEDVSHGSVRIVTGKKSWMTEKSGFHWTFYLSSATSSFSRNKMVGTWSWPILSSFTVNNVTSTVVINKPCE